VTPQERRIAALRRFAFGISTLTVVGHLWLGLEQSWLQVLVSLATCYAVELTLEAIDAWSAHRAPRFRGGPLALVDFLLPAHITALAIALLLYPGDRLWPIVLAGVIAVGSKSVFRAPVGGGSRHFLNPSNFGMAVTLLALPSVGIAPPYHFTENVSGWGDWAVPAFVLCTGTLLNVKLTGKVPLIAAWLGGFALQAVARHLVLGASLEAALLPMTGMAFLLFTFYMVTDPGTTPIAPRSQVAFGAAVAAAYGVLLAVHVVFGLFFALAIVSLVRGVALHAIAYARRTEESRAPVPRPVREPVLAGRPERAR
jgi:Na+-translocating ferredoxin:NAD+ oxidoreductase RnfD subunit